MTILIHSAIILACAFGLWFGAVWIVDSAVKIAKQLGLSELVIGLTVVAIATSAPEFAVTVVAAINGQAAISVGNIVGSNIFNLGFILGLIALFKTVRTSENLVYRDGSFLLGAGILLLFFFRDLELSFPEGIILIATLVTYILILILKKEKVEEPSIEGKYKWYDIPKIIVGAAVIITSASYFVQSASELAKMIGVSDWLIGITIVAAGTSAPELATSIVAVTKGRFGISAGNLIGSDLFNMLGVLGVASVMRDLPIQSSDYNSLIFLAVNLLLLLFLMKTGWKLTKTEGALLILIAIFRWTFDFL